MARYGEGEKMSRAYKPFMVKSLQVFLLLRHFANSILAWLSVLIKGVKVFPKVWVGFMLLSKKAEKNS